jgi:hypothetical protein
MKPADLRDRYDVTVTWRGDPAGDRRVLVQRQVSPRLFVVRTIQRHQPLQARFIEHNHVIEAFTTRGSDKSLDECIGVSRRLHHMRVMWDKRFASHIPSCMANC